MSIAKNSQVAKAASVFVSLTLALSLVGGVAFTANAATVDELMAQIAALQAQVLSMQGSTGSAGAALSGVSFGTNLSLGMRSTDVQNLQKVLNSNAATKIASSGAGSPGSETTYFGALTKTAVIKFQDLYKAEVLTPSGLTKGTGYVGPSTRAKLNTMTSATTGGTTSGTTGTTGTTATTGTGLSIATVEQPSASLAPIGAVRLPFTKVKLTAGLDGDVTVNGVVVERVGLGIDSNFAGIVLVDENGGQIGLEKTLGSDHRATVGEPIIIKAGQSRTFTIAGNMSSDTTVMGNNAGQVVALSVVGVQTTATVSGSTPITGAAHTINATLSIGSVTMANGGTDPGASNTKNVGTTGYTFASIRTTAGSTEKVYLKSIRWNQSGSVAASDIANVKTYVDGVAYDTVVSTDGKYYTSTFGSGILIDKGGNKEVSIKGDIVNGSGRTVNFDLYRRTDFVLVGETYGYGITPPNGTDAAGTDDGAFHLSTNPWYDGYKVTVSAGTLNAEKSATVAAGNIAVNVADQVLGAFSIEGKGEPVTASQMVFHYVYGTTNANTTGVDITSISLVDSTGTVVAGPVDGAGTTAGYGSVTFTSSVTFPVGVGTYTLKGKLSTDFTNGMTVAASTTPGTDWTSVTGQTTGNTVTPTPATAVTGNTMTVRAANVAITVSPDPIAQTIVGGSAKLFANYRFDLTQSGEDIRFSSIPLAYEAVGGSTATNLTNCQIFDSTGKSLTSGSNAVNPTASATSTTFTFDSPGFIAPKEKVTTLTLRCNVAAGSTGSYRWGIDAYGDSTTSFTATGVTSAVALTDAASGGITTTESVGQLMTLATAGTLTVTADPSAPSYAIAQAGTSNNVLGVLKFHAADEAITLKKVSLIMSNAAASSTPQNLSKVTLWNEAGTQVGEVVFTSRYATSTELSTFVIPKDGDAKLTIKGDLAAIGTSLGGTEGALIQVDYNGSDLSGTYGNGEGGTQINSTSGSNTAFSGVRTFRAYPVFTKLSVPAVTLSSGQTVNLYRFSVRAVGGDVNIYKFTVNIATSASPVNTASSTVTDLKVKAFTDSAFQSAAGNFTTAGQVNTTIATLPSSGNSDILVTGSSNSYFTIPASATWYFDVIGTITFSGAVTSAQVVTNIQGDSVYTDISGTSALMNNASDVDGATNDDFIWSPNATGTSITTANDWTNGYYVQGLGSDNMDNQTLSK